MMELRRIEQKIPQRFVSRRMFPVKVNMNEIFLLLFSLLVAAGITSGSFSGRKYLNPGVYWDQPFSKPYFDNTTKTEVTVTVGTTAYLHCRIRNLGQSSVSWIRKRDIHILTVGILTYTSDQRFQSLHSDGTDEWTLKVSSSQTRDSGTYECQVSTEPKISMAFQLSVVVSQAEIQGNSELHLKSGSDINLTCIVRQTPEPPSFIYWYHGRNVINYSSRGGINVVTEKQTRTSRLLISKAQPSDSGNYTCSPSNSHPASVFVHVLNGEHPAAMQHGNNSGDWTAHPSFTFYKYYPLFYTMYTIVLSYILSIDSFILDTDERRKL